MLITQLQIWDKNHPYVFSEMLKDPPKKGPWGALKKGLNGYDREMCDAWNGELDTLLTFVRASS